jgi:hypothetical protein
MNLQATMLATTTLSTELHLPALRNIIDIMLRYFG